MQPLHPASAMRPEVDQQEVESTPPPFACRIEALEGFRASGLRASSPPEGPVSRSEKKEILTIFSLTNLTPILSSLQNRPHNHKYEFGLPE